MNSDLFLDECEIEVNGSKFVADVVLWFRKDNFGTELVLRNMVSKNYSVMTSLGSFHIGYERSLEKEYENYIKKEFSNTTSKIYQLCFDQWQKDNEY